jgi:potassium-transporting ATPase KdpC subunit
VSPRGARSAVALVLIMTMLLGFAYPLVITGVAQVVFPAQAAGSLVVVEGRLRGSRLIGQNFTDPEYFWGRPSASTPLRYDALASGGSNLGPLNPALITNVRSYSRHWREADPDNHRLIPVELVTASASGLDPEISPAAAAYQAARVARARGIPVAAVQAFVTTHLQGRVLGFLGEPRLNVLELNLALDHTAPAVRH